MIDTLCSCFSNPEAFQKAIGEDYGTRACCVEVNKDRPTLLVLVANRYTDGA